MIRKQDLGRPKFIAKGAVGSVYRLPDFTLPGCPPLAYKEVRAPVPGEFTPEARQRALDAMAKSVVFRAGLGRADRDDLDQYTTWPIDMVEDNGAPCGLVMPLIPPDFFIRAKPRTGPPKDLVFDLSWLSAKEAQARVEGIDRSAVRDLLVRIALLAQLVYAVGRLHRHGAVYGDLSLKNVALAVNPPRIKLLDCDAAAALADLGRDQLHSPFFKPPENASNAQKLQDDRTDIYKLGLCIIRGLQQGPGITQAKNPAALARTLDANAIDTITRAVGADRAARPTARELYDCLERNILARASAPVLHSARLSRSALVRGQDLEVIWEAAGGKEVRISGPGGLDVVVPAPGTTPARCVVTPTASGAIEVAISNAHGDARAFAGDVQLYELPSFQVDLTGLPRPVVPAVAAVRLPPVLRSLPPMPAVSTARHAVPRIELPPLAPVSDVLAVMRTVPPPSGPVTDVGATVGQVAQVARQALRAATAQPDLSMLATRTALSVHEVLETERRRLCGRLARDVQSIPKQGTTAP